jgi:transmembrane sensor
MDDEGVPGRAPRQDQLLEEASLWFARMRGPDAEEFRPAFERWLALGAAHLGAYNRAGEVFALGKFLSETPDERTIEERNHVGSLINWRLSAIAASLLLLVGVSGWFSRDLVAPQLSPSLSVATQGPRHSGALTQFSTKAGERRTLALPDGSKVSLEPDSVLATKFGSERRELRLERGRARFEVAHEQRPFVVLAGGGSVTARGTIFDVIVDHDQGVTVHLLRGAVDVERTPKTANGGARLAIVTRLEPGETLNFGTKQAPVLAEMTPTVPPVGVKPSSFASEAMEFDRTPLSQIVERANHGAAVSIRLADPAIGDLKVSGRFRIDDAEQVAERLAALFNLKADRIGEKEIILRAR